MRSMKLPEKESLVRQTIDVLKEMMRNGELVSPIPGERTLASHLQVGRDTLRSALNELTRMGWISESAQGKRREILKITKAAPKKKQKTKRILFLSPQRLEEIPRLMLIELNSLRTLLAKRSIVVDVISPSIFDTAHPEKRLEQLVIDYPADAWILYRCTEPVQRWFQEKKIPCIVRGYPHPNISLPYLDEDWKAAAFHAGTRLLSHGHKSVGIVVPDAQLAGLKAAEQGLFEAVDKAGEGHYFHQVQEKKDIPSLVKSVQEALSSAHPPTALVLTRPRHVLSLSSWLATFGYSIPEHLSIVALCHEPWFEDFYYPITHYTTPPENMSKSLAKQIRHLLSGTPLPSGQSYVIPEHVAGESIKSI
ncbi:substrate-binding domain-containing protein [Rubritalea tangerina]